MTSPDDTARRYRQTTPPDDTARRYHRAETARRYHQTILPDDTARRPPSAPGHPDPNTQGQSKNTAGDTALPSIIQKLPYVCIIRCHSCQSELPVIKLYNYQQTTCPSGCAKQPANKLQSQSTSNPAAMTESKEPQAPSSSSVPHASEAKTRQPPQ